MVQEDMNINMSFVAKDMSGIVAAQTNLNQLVGVFSNVGEGIARNVGAIDAAVATAGVSLGILSTQAARAYGEFERGQAIVQTVSDSTNAQMQILGHTAQQFSSEFRIGIDEVNEGLTTLGRAGLTDVNNQIETLRQGFSLAKIEGMNLATALEEIVQTTSLLGGDIHSTNFGMDTEKVTNMLVGTSLSGPLDVNDVVQTLKYVGGTAAAAGANLSNEDLLYDLMGTTSAFAQKGVVGSMAGTALRAFLSKPASQDNSVWEGLKEIGLEPYDLWEDGQQEMKPISEQIHIIRQAMKDNNKSTMDQLEIWGKLVGTKMGQQMMKLDEDTIQESTSTIRQKASAETLANKSMQNFASQQEEIMKSLETIWRNYGKTVADVLSPILEIMKPVVDFFANDSSGSKFAIMGIVMVVNTLLGKALGSIKEVLKFVWELVSKSREQVSLTKQETTTTEDLLVQNKALTNELQQQAAAKKQIATFSNVDENHMRYQSSGLSFGKTLYMHPDNVNALTPEQKARNGLLLNDLQTYMQIGNNNKDIEREINAMVQEYYQREVKPWLSAGNTADNFAGYIDANVVDDFLPKTMSMFEGADYDSELQYSIRNEMARQIRNAALYGKLDDNGNVRLRGIGNMIGDAFGGAIYKSGDFSGNIFSYDKALGKYGVLNAKTGNLDTRKDSVTGYFGVSNYGQFPDKPGNPGKALPFMDPNKFISSADGQRRRQETLNRINGNLTGNVTNIARESSSINKNIVGIPGTLSSIEASLNTMTNTIRRDTTLETSKASGNKNSSSDYRRSWGGSEKANKLGSSMDSLTTAVYKLKASFDGAFQPYQRRFRKNSSFNKIDEEGYELIGYSSDTQKVKIESKIDELLDREREFKKGYGVRINPNTRDLEIATVVADNEGNFLTKEWRNRGYMGVNASNEELKDYGLRRNGGRLERQNRQGEWYNVRLNEDIGPSAIRAAKYDRSKLDYDMIFKDLEGGLGKSFLRSDSYQAFKGDLYHTKPRNFFEKLNTAPQALGDIPRTLINDALSFTRLIPEVEDKYTNFAYGDKYDDILSKEYSKRESGTIPQYLYRMENLLKDIRKNTYKLSQAFDNFNNPSADVEDSSIQTQQPSQQKPSSKYQWMLNPDGSMSEEYIKNIQQGYTNPTTLKGHDGLSQEDIEKIDFSSIGSTRIGLHTLMADLDYEDIEEFDENDNVITTREYKTPEDEKKAYAINSARALLNKLEKEKNLIEGMANSFVSLDLETQGLNPLDENSKILEYGWAQYNQGQLVKQGEQLIYHDDVNPNYVQKYGDEYHAGLPRQEESLSQLRQSLAEAGVLSGDTPIVGHNIEHDLSFLKENGVILDDELKNVRFYDTMQLAKGGFFGDINPNFYTDEYGETLKEHWSLRNVLSEKGIENTNPHHALGDAMATGELFNTITREGINVLEQNTAAVRQNTGVLKNNRVNAFNDLLGEDDADFMLNETDSITDKKSKIDQKIKTIDRKIEDVKREAYNQMDQVVQGSSKSSDYKAAFEAGDFDSISGIKDKQRDDFTTTTSLNVENPLGYGEKDENLGYGDFSNLHIWDDDSVDFDNGENIFNPENKDVVDLTLDEIKNKTLGKVTELEAEKAKFIDAKKTVLSGEKDTTLFNSTNVPLPVIDYVNDIIDTLPNASDYDKLTKTHTTMDALATVQGLLDDENLSTIPEAANKIEELQKMQIAMGGVDDLLTNIKDDVDGIVYPSMFSVTGSNIASDPTASYVIAKSVIDDIVNMRKEYDNPRKTPSATEIGDNLSKNLHSPDDDATVMDKDLAKQMKTEEIDELLKSVKRGNINPWYAEAIAAEAELNPLYGNPFASHPKATTIGRRAEEGQYYSPSLRRKIQDKMDIDEWYKNPNMFGSTDQAYLTDTHKSQMFWDINTGTITIGRPEDGNFYKRNLIPIGDIGLNALAKYGIGVPDTHVSKKHDRDTSNFDAHRGFVNAKSEDLSILTRYGQLSALNSFTNDILNLSGIEDILDENLIESLTNSSFSKIFSSDSFLLEDQVYNLSAEELLTNTELQGKFVQALISYQTAINEHIKNLEIAYQKLQAANEYEILDEERFKTDSESIYDEEGNYLGESAIYKEGRNTPMTKKDAVENLGPSRNSPYVSTVADALFIPVEDDVFNGVEEIVQRNQENAKERFASIERQKELALLDSVEGDPQQAYARYYMKNSDRVKTALSNYVQNNLDIENPDTVVNEFMAKLESEKGILHNTPEFSKTLARVDTMTSDLLPDWTNSRFRAFNLMELYSNKNYSEQPMLLRHITDTTQGRLYEAWDNFVYSVDSQYQHTMEMVEKAKQGLLSPEELSSPELSSRNVSRLEQLKAGIEDYGMSIMTHEDFRSDPLLNDFKQQITSDFSDVFTATGMLRQKMFEPINTLKAELSTALQEMTYYMQTLDEFERYDNTYTTVEPYAGEDVADYKNKSNVEPTEKRLQRALDQKRNTLKEEKRKQSDKSNVEMYDFANYDYYKTSDGDVISLPNLNQQRIKARKKYAEQLKNVTEKISESEKKLQHYADVIEENGLLPELYQEEYDKLDSRRYALSEYQSYLKNQRVLGSFDDNIRSYNINRARGVFNSANYNFADDMVDVMGKIEPFSEMKEDARSMRFSQMFDSYRPWEDSLYEQIRSKLEDDVAKHASNVPVSMLKSGAGISDSEKITLINRLGKEIEKIDNQIKSLGMPHKNMVPYLEDFHKNLDGYIDSVYQMRKSPFQQEYVHNMLTSDKSRDSQGYFIQQAFKSVLKDNIQKENEKRKQQAFERTGRFSKEDYTEVSESEMMSQMILHADDAIDQVINEIKKEKERAIRLMKESEQISQDYKDITNEIRAAEVAKKDALEEFAKLQSMSEFERLSQVSLKEGELDANANAYVRDYIAAQEGVQKIYSPEEQEKRFKNSYLDAMEADERELRKLEKTRQDYDKWFADKTRVPTTPSSISQQYPHPAWPAYGYSNLSPEEQEEQFKNSYLSVMEDRERELEKMRQEYDNWLIGGPVYHNPIPKQPKGGHDAVTTDFNTVHGLNMLFGVEATERDEWDKTLKQRDLYADKLKKQQDAIAENNKKHAEQMEAKYGPGRGMLTIDQIRTLPAGVARDSLMKEYMSKLSPFQRFQARIGMSPAVTVDKEGKVQTKGFFERIKASTGTFGKLGSAVSSVTNMMGGPMMAAMTTFQAVMMLYSKVVEDEQKKITDAETRTSEAQTRYDEAVQNWEASREKADENWSNYSQNDKEQAFIDTMIQGAQQSSLRDNYITWKDPNRYDDLTDAEKKDLETKENSEALSANTRALYLATLSLNAAMQSEDYLKNNSDYTGYYGLQANINENLLEGSGLQRSGNQFGIYDTFNPEMWDKSDGWIQQLNSLQESFLQFNTRVKNMEDMSTDYMRIAAALDKKNGMNIEQILNSPYEMRKGEKVAWSSMNQEAGMNGTLMARYMKQYEKHLKAFERRFVRLERNQKGGIVLKGGQWKSMLPGLAKAMNVTEQQAKMMVLIHMLSRINEVVQSQIKPLVQETTQSVMQSVMYGKGTTEGTYQNANINAATSGMVNAISSNVATIALQTAHEAAVDAYNIKHPDATVEDFAQLERVANGDDWLYKFNNMFSSTGAGQASAYDVINNPDTGMLRGLATTAASLNSDLKTKEQRDAWIEKWLSKNQLADLGKPKTMHGSQSEFAKYVREHPELNGSISGYNYLTQTWTVGKENLYSKIAEFERAITGEMTPHIADMTMQAINSALDTENDEGDVGGSGKGGGDKDYDNNNNRQRYVQLAICNKKAIPKLNVNLFKKAPSFTVMNKNFKLRDIKINTADKAKNIESAVKNAIIDVQERSDPKIIQDEEAEYDPVGATDGDNLPTGTTQTNNN